MIHVKNMQLHNQEPHLGHYRKKFSQQNFSENWSSFSWPVSGRVWTTWLPNQEPHLGDDRNFSYNENS